jgi:CMP-N,N'-diacetyllegionaminic acid synthase
MINNKKVLAIIPARGGSKRLPRKNILDLGGKPLIAWTIEAAIECEYIDRVIVSTEDQEIREISEKYGEHLPFFRPSELAHDDITTYDVVIDIVERLNAQNELYEYILLLQPTSPLRTSHHIDSACWELSQDSKIKSMVSICKAEHHPLWSNMLPNDKFMGNFLPNEIHNIRSQDLPEYFRLNGAIYICETKILISEKTFQPKKSCFAFMMDQADSIDIDTLEDLNLAKLYLDPSIVKKSDLFQEIYESYKRKSINELDIDQFKNYLLGLLNEK